MPPRRVSDDSGSASVEFTLLVSLFVAPTLNAAQEVTAMQLRQSSLDSIAQTLARDYSLHGDSSRLNRLADQLSDDAGMQRELLSWQLDCDGYSSCDSLGNGLNGGTVSISVHYRQASARAMQILDETGSVLPILLAGFALVFAALAVGVNIQAAGLYDQRASSLARYLAHSSIDQSPGDGRVELTNLANQISQKMLFSTQPVESAWLSSADGKTNTVAVCLGFKAPIDLLALPVSRACAQSSMRRVEGKG